MNLCFLNTTYTMAVIVDALADPVIGKLSNRVISNKRVEHGTVRDIDCV